MVPRSAPGRGWPEWRRAGATSLSAWDHFQAQVDEYRELDDERVLVLVHFKGRGKSSGLEASQWTTTKGGLNLFHVRGGKVTRLVIYFDRERALADLGLASETGSSPQ